MELNIDVEKLRHQYQILEELHGSSSRDELLALVAIDFGVTILDVYNAINLKVKSEKVKEYGLILGRFQPFHYGHQHIINEVILDGRVPIIALGDDGGKDNVRNPLTTDQRQELIRLIYPNHEIVFITVNDNSNWSDWFFNLGHSVIGNSGRHMDQVVMYFNNKEQDRYDHFECNGKEYVNEFYTKIFEDNGVRTQRVEFVERNDIVVDADATNIRDNLEAFKHLLDGRIYWKLKDWGW